MIVFDRMRGPLVDFLRRRYFGTSTKQLPAALAVALRRTLSLTERTLTRSRFIRPSPDDILDAESELAKRFRGSDVVIHLAGLPHPSVRGVTDSEFRRINYEGSVNVFRAARTAGVPKFIFASSAQVYAIHKPVRIDQFPILETNYTPTLAEGQTVYGSLKRDFEMYLDRECNGQGIQAISLRMEFPGVRSRYPWNFYISTSVENVIEGFIAAIEAEMTEGLDVFNLADGQVDPRIVNIQDFVDEHWPHVPNYTTDNECLLGTEKARLLLGYRPRAGGTYFSLSAML